VLLPIVSRTVFHSDAVYGTGLACYGIGGLVGGLVTMMWRPRSPGTLAVLCLPLYALVPLALLTAEHGWIIFAAYLLAGAGIETYAIHWDVAVQREIPHHLLGRVSSLAWLSTFGMMPIGQALTGPITEAIGATTLLWTAAAVMLLVPPLMLRVRGMRQFHTPVDPRPDPSVTERMP
jgi:predicted MFS family arabinose efflux permease